MPDRQLFLKTAAASGYAGQLAEDRLRDIGLPAFLVATLTHIRDLEPVAPSAISSISGVPMTTLRDNIQRLADRKLVRRTPNPEDGRSYLLRLTPRGRRVAEATGDALLAAYLALERRLPRPLAEYERVLDELNASLELTLRDLAASR